MPNVVVRKKKKLSLFRKMALGTWRTAYDPSVYGTLTVRMDAALDYIERFRQKTGKRLTVTHLTAKVLANAIQEMPDANALLRWGGIYLRDNVTIAFQVALEPEEPGGRIDLSALTLRNVEDKDIGQICDELTAAAERTRKREDKAMEAARGRFRFMPTFMVHYVLRLMAFVSYTLNWNLSKLGIPRDPFGSAFITNIGSLGLESAYVPLVPYSRAPILLALGAIADMPVVEDGRIVPGKVMNICATFDHRVMDGAHAAIMSRVVRRCFANPDDAFGPIA